MDSSELLHCCWKVEVAGITLENDSLARVAYTLLCTPAVPLLGTTKCEGDKGVKTQNDRRVWMFTVALLPVTSA